MDKRLEEIRARADAATEGPWEITTFPSPHYNRTINVQSGRTFVCWRDMLGEDTWSDFRFIALARTDVPWLLDQLTRSQGRIAELEGAIRDNWLWEFEGYEWDEVWDDQDDFCVFCKAEVGIDWPHTATCIVLTLPE